MSFYEDSVADGSHCGSCCQYIGGSTGYARLCKSCDSGLDNTGGLSKSQKTNLRKKRARIRKAQEAAQ